MAKCKIVKEVYSDYRNKYSIKWVLYERVLVARRWRKPKELWVERDHAYGETTLKNLREKAKVIMQEGTVEHFG